MTGLPWYANDKLMILTIYIHLNFDVEGSLFVSWSFQEFVKNTFLYLTFRRLINLNKKLKGPCVYRCARNINIWTVCTGIYHDEHDWRLAVIILTINLIHCDQTTRIKITTSEHRKALTIILSYLHIRENCITRCHGCKQIKWLTDRSPCIVSPHHQRAFHWTKSICNGKDGVLNINLLFIDEKLKINLIFII